MLTIKVREYTGTGARTMIRGSRTRYIASGHVGTIVETQMIRELVQKPHEYRKETAVAPGDWPAQHGALDIRTADNSY